MAASGGRSNWVPEEDSAIIALVSKYGRSWSTIATELNELGLAQERSSKQIRARYLNTLCVQSEHAWTPEEETILYDKQQELGNKWASIAKFLPGRSDNSIKNHYYSTMRRNVRKLAAAVAGAAAGAGGPGDAEAGAKAGNSKGTASVPDALSGGGSSSSGSREGAIDLGRIIESLSALDEGSAFKRSYAVLQDQLAANEGLLVLPKRGGSRGGAGSSSGASSSAVSAAAAVAPILKSLPRCVTSVLTKPSGAAALLHASPSAASRAAASNAVRSSRRIRERRSGDDDDGDAAGQHEEEEGAEEAEAATAAAAAQPGSRKRRRTEASPQLSPTAAVSAADGSGSGSGGGSGDGEHPFVDTGVREKKRARKARAASASSTSSGVGSEIAAARALSVFSSSPLASAAAAAAAAAAADADAAASGGSGSGAGPSVASTLPMPTPTNAGSFSSAARPFLQLDGLASMLDGSTTVGPASTLGMGLSLNGAEGLVFGQLSKANSPPFSTTPALSATVLAGTHVSRRISGGRAGSSAAAASAAAASAAAVPILGISPLQASSSPMLSPTDGFANPYWMTSSMGDAGAFTSQAQAQAAAAAPAAASAGRRGRGKASASQAAQQDYYASNSAAVNSNSMRPPTLDVSDSALYAADEEEVEGAEDRDRDLDGAGGTGGAIGGAAQPHDTRGLMVLSTAASPGLGGMMVMPSSVMLQGYNGLLPSGSPGSSSSIGMGMPSVTSSSGGASPRGGFRTERFV